MVVSIFHERLSRYQARERPDLGLRKAAVLIPIQRSETIFFTQRASHLNHHQGQISFPGGRLDAGETGWQAALREAEEEVGLAASQVVPLGRIDDVYSPLGYHIQCYVGAVSDDWTPQPNIHEVDSVIAVPLEELLDEARHSMKPWPRDPTIQVHYFDFTDAMVWGVTGWMTRILQSVLRGESVPDLGYRLA